MSIESMQKALKEYDAAKASSSSPSGSFAMMQAASGLASEVRSYLLANHPAVTPKCSHGCDVSAGPTALCIVDKHDMGGVATTDATEDEREALIEVIYSTPTPVGVLDRAHWNYPVTVTELADSLLAAGYRCTPDEAQVRANERVREFLESGASLNPFAYKNIRHVKSYRDACRDALNALNEDPNHLWPDDDHADAATIAETGRES